MLVQIYQCMNNVEYSFKTCLPLTTTLDRIAVITSVDFGYLMYINDVGYVVCLHNGSLKIIFFVRFSFPPNLPTPPHTPFLPIDCSL